jgi:hypothetical protein
VADADTAPIVVYLAHPVGAPDAAGVEANLQRARQWLRWLIDLPNPAVQRIAWCVPWWAYVDTLGDGARHYRERGLRDTLAAAARCDALVACGKLTPGVTIELAQAERQGQPAVNLIALGALPPTTGETNWWASRPTAGVIAELVELVAKVQRKRDRRAEALAAQRVAFGGAAAPTPPMSCSACLGTGKELIDCEGSAGYRPCPYCKAGTP